MLVYVGGQLNRESWTSRHTRAATKTRPKRGIRIFICKFRGCVDAVTVWRMFEFWLARVDGQICPLSQSCCRFRSWRQSIARVGLFGALSALLRLFLESQVNAYPRAEMLTPKFTTGRSFRSSFLLSSKCPLSYNSTLTREWKC